MKIILSRKGFDASFGGFPSPILPDGKILSLPIPVAGQPTSFDQVQFEGRPISEYVSDLSKGKIGERDSCHLDPDLRRGSIPRSENWRPTFGQVNAAQAHLENQGIGQGDLFLFFGWFRQTEYNGEKLAFAKNAKSFHLIFGWLQIDEVRKPNPSLVEQYPWLSDHPHCNDFSKWGKNNTVYLATEKLHLNGRVFDNISGGGAISNYSDSLRLSAPGYKRSIWHLPRWFYPPSSEAALTYHKNLDRWKITDKHTILNTVGRGQEFVMNSNDYPRAEKWVSELISGGKKESDTKELDQPPSIKSSINNNLKALSNTQVLKLKPKSIGILLALEKEANTDRLISAYNDFFHTIDAHLSFSTKRTGRGLELISEDNYEVLGKIIDDESAKSVVLLKAAYLFGVIYMEMMLGFVCEKPSISFNKFLKRKREIEISKLARPYSIAIYRNKLLAHHDHIRIQCSTSKIGVGEIRLQPIGWGVTLPDRDRKSLEDLIEKYRDFLDKSLIANRSIVPIELVTELFYHIPPDYGMQEGHDRFEVNRLGELIGVKSLTAIQLLDTVDDFTQTIIEQSKTQTRNF